jgi:hypothetical protein
MAELSLATEHSIMEVGKSIGADGNQLAMIDTLSKEVPIIEDGYWVESNDFLTHHYLQALTEPTGSDGVINVGVDWELGTTRPVTEPMQEITSASRIDIRLLEKQRNPEAYRAMKSKMTVRGMTKTAHSRFFYGNHAVYPDQIDGMATRYGTLSGTWDNVQNNGDSGALVQTSIWCIKWGPEATQLVYPYNGQNFVKEDDMGKQITYDSNSKAMRTVVSFFTFNFGVAPTDPRQIQRVCNIGGTHLFDAEDLITALSKIPGGLDGVIIYVPRPVWTQMNIAANAKTNAVYGVGELWGRPVMTFFTCPVRMCEQIVATEAVVA